MLLVVVSYFLAKKMMKIHIQISRSASISNSVVVSLVPQEFSDAGAGYFCPLTGFHNKEDALSICEE